MPAEGVWATVYALIYGDQFDLHLRLMETLLTRIPPNRAKICLWCAQVEDNTLEMVRWFQKEHGNCWMMESDQNLGKYVVMRRMWREFCVPETPWVLWLDDDVYAHTEGWWEVCETMVPSTPEVVGALGSRSVWVFKKGQVDWIKEAKWYKGKPFLQRVGLDSVAYPYGTYFWLRTPIIDELDWPDFRLIHGGQGDVMLGAALYQNGYGVSHFVENVVRSSDIKRRGMVEEWVDGKIVRRRPGDDDNDKAMFRMV